MASAIINGQELVTTSGVCVQSPQGKAEVLHQFSGLDGTGSSSKTTHRRRKKTSREGRNLRPQDSDYPNQKHSAIVRAQRLGVRIRKGTLAARFEIEKPKMERGYEEFHRSRTTCEESITLGRKVDGTRKADLAYWIVKALFTRGSIDAALADPGVNTPLAYASTPAYGALFSGHVEDFPLISIHYVVQGAPEIWCLIPQSQAERFEEAMARELIGKLTQSSSSMALTVFRTFREAINFRAIFADSLKDEEEAGLREERQRRFRRSALGMRLRLRGR
ncbi:hypothetical protein MMC27_001260 [Xylographa pallens]|nr:hypothetical protein [Xylographa pallens]